MPEANTQLAVYLVLVTARFEPTEEALFSIFFAGRCRDDIE